VSAGAMHCVFISVHVQFASSFRCFEFTIVMVKTGYCKCIIVCEPPCIRTLLLLAANGAGYHLTHPTPCIPPAGVLLWQQPLPGLWPQVLVCRVQEAARLASPLHPRALGPALPPPRAPVHGESPASWLA
jgi:hypothetical protein